MDEGSAREPDEPDPEGTNPGSNPEEAEDAELGAAVDDALRTEARRQFVERFLGVDRAEGTGRGEAHWNEALYRDQQRELGMDDPPD